MQSINKLLIYALLPFAIGCAGKKKYVVSERKVVDSVVVRVERIKAPLLSDVLTIPELCPDSVKAVEFKRVFIRDTDTILVEVVNDSLVVKIKQAEKLLSEKDQQLILRSEEIKRLSATTTSRTSLKTILGFLIVLVVFVVFPGIPRAIHDLFVKLIRGGV